MTRCHARAFSGNRTATVTNKLVPSTWRICVIDPDVCAWNLLATFQPFPIMLTHPSLEPRNRLSEPVHKLEISLLSKSCRVSSSGSETCVTSKKSKDFHYYANS